MLDIVTAGETMVALVPHSHGPLRYVQNFSMRTAGAESNVAVGMVKMGHTCGWISKLGEDEFGEYILRELRGEGVDVSCVVQAKELSTAVMFKQFGPGDSTSISYYRRNSAASTLSPEDIDENYVKSAKIVHLTGVTPALSHSCRALTEHMANLSAEAGNLLSFDPNIRLKLWDAESACQVLQPLLLRCDIAMLGEDEGKLLLGADTPSEIISLLRKSGVSYIAIKRGEQGAVVANRETMVDIPAVKTAVVDTVGAGDAFNTGFLCGILEGKDIRACGEAGALLGALTVSVRGDVEGIPTRSQFESLRDQTTVIFR